MEAAVGNEPPSVRRGSNLERGSVDLTLYITHDPCNGLQNTDLQLLSPCDAAVAIGS
jgi:hypothetical protein